MFARALMRAPTPGGGGITTPSFIAAGTGSEIASGGGNLTPAYGTNAAGDCFLAVGVAYASTITDPSGWTLVFGPDTFAGNQNNYLWYRNLRSSGGESGTVNFPLGDRGNARIYTFRNVATSSFIEAHATASSNTTAVTNPTITPAAAGRLGCLCYMGFSTAGTIVPGGTPSGGTWAEVAEFVGSLDIFYHELQTADLSGGGAISGGDTTVGGTFQAFCHGFALVGA